MHRLDGHMDARLKVGVVGAGIGKAHIAAYRQLPQLYAVEAVCDLDVDRAAAVAAEHDIRVIAPDSETLLSLDLDIVDLCTPSSQHFEQTARVLQAGRHVVVEKPIARSLAEVDQLAEIEQRSGRRVSPVFQYRFGNGLARLAHLKLKGLAGRPHVATVETHLRRRPDYYAAQATRGRWTGDLGADAVAHGMH